MKRKLLALLTALLLLATMITPAFADLIWEPQNSFFERNRTECEYVDRAYIANGAEGYVTITTSPNSHSKLANIGNGTTLYISFVWTDKDGTQWGIGYPAGEFDTEGWTPLADLAQIYDYRDFEEDHGGEFRDYDGSGDDLGKALVFSYPGGVVKSTLEENPSYMTFAEAFHNLYTDENGLRWTYIGYYMGHREGWVCIDDPMNEGLGADVQRTVDQVRGIANEQIPAAVDVPDTGAFPMWLIPVVLVIVVAVVTAVIVRRRKR